MSNTIDTPEQLTAAHVLPARIALSRRKGWKMPPNTVKVCRPGRWGNPFRTADFMDLHNGDQAAAQADCVRSYQQWLTDENSWYGGPRPPSLEEIRAELAGKNLACWCKEGTPCHADVLLRLANPTTHHAAHGPTLPEKLRQASEVWKVVAWGDVRECRIIESVMEEVRDALETGCRTISIERQGAPNDQGEAQPPAK